MSERRRINFILVKAAEEIDPSKLREVFLSNEIDTKELAEILEDDLMDRVKSKFTGEVIHLSKSTVMAGLSNLISRL